VSENTKRFFESSSNGFHSLADDFRLHNHGSLSTWSLEKGYMNSEKSSYPYRTSTPGLDFSLDFHLMLNESDFDYTCRDAGQGFKVVLHSPADFPVVSKSFFRVPMDQEVLVSVRPNLVTTSAGLRRHSPNVRRCYFDGERKLKFFKVYTQSNCELECLSDFTFKQCGCVKFSMPRDNNTRICSQTEVPCYNDARMRWTSVEFDLSDTSKFKCRCLPSCTSIAYDAEVSNIQKQKRQKRHADDLDWSFNQVKATKILIYFKNDQFDAPKRSEFYSWANFFADCGGLLGKKHLTVKRH
jgi:amiloride-sensitive sodium channel